MAEQHGFNLIEERNIPEINTHARLFQHEKTGARLLSLENDDDNKSFLITFKTPPEDNTGLPHIMEHSVLCGSRKYPVKDPFKQLLKTSVKTFLNAMTAADFTIYPVASTNLQDFYNLVDVYYDAVFFPNISEQILMQEGWHFQTEGQDAPLNFNGIVFNEMKAAYSSPDRLLYELADKTSLPDTPYALSSGGDPAAIPNLTYAQFKNFHETYYHPSNAYIVFWGDDNPEERLRISNEYLSEFDALSINSELPLQAPFEAPVRVMEKYDAGDADASSNKSMMMMTWVLPEVTDLQTMTDLSVLSYSLVSTPASPLRKALLDSGLGEGLTGGGLSTSSRQARFHIGLKGITAENAEKVEALIIETLSKVAEEGLDRATLEAALNTIEFHARERNTGQFPRGLATGMSVIRSWIHGADPLDALAFEARLEQVKEQFLEDNDAFEQMIGTYLLDNPHRSTVVIKPDPEVGSTRDAAERERLEKAREAMNSDDIERVIAIQKELRDLQVTPDSPENLDKIPSLALSDIEREIKIIPQNISEYNHAGIFFHEQATSGIVYIDVVFDLRTLAPEYLSYVELFGEALTKMGTTSEDYVRLSQRIGIHTGGIGATTMTTMKRDSDGYVAYLVVRSKATSGKTADLLAILKDILLTTNFDQPERFKQIVLERKASFERALPFSGHSVAASRIRAQFNPVEWAEEQFGGADALFFLRALAEKIGTDWNSILNALETIRATLINRATMLINATMEGQMWQHIEAELHGFIDTIPLQDVQIMDWPVADPRDFECLTMPLQVSFNAKCANLYTSGYQLDGSVSVITKHLSREYLWEKIRVVGGAYGGAVQFSANSGLLTFLSWRDPHVIATMENFDHASAYLMDLNLSQSDVEKAIIGAIGDLDRHQLPDAKGFSAFIRHLMGYTDEMRQQYRDEVLSTTLEDFREFGAAIRGLPEVSRSAVVTSSETLANLKNQIPHDIIVTKLD